MSASPTKMMISVDPAVTVKESSDYTGIAVVGYNAANRRCTVFECLQVKLGPEALRARLIRLAEQYPRVTEIVVEVNQGGGLWDRILHDMPVRVRATSASITSVLRYWTFFCSRLAVIQLEPSLPVRVSARLNAASA